MKFNLIHRYILIVVLAIVALLLKQPLGLDAYPFSLLYWVIVTGAWVDNWRGGLFSAALAIALGWDAGASPYRCFWFGLEALAIVLVMGARRHAILAHASSIRQGEVKDEFFDKSSHGMKGHIANIRVGLDYLGILMPDAPEKARSVMGVLSKECDRLTRLVSNTLKIQRLEFNNIEIGADPILLEFWVRGQIEAYQTLADRKNLKLIYEVNQIEAQFYSDFQLLEDIFSELLLNACKYTPSGGTVKLSAVIINKQLIIKVANNGSLTEEQLSQIFERFYRIREREEEGSGLGLAIAKKQIETLGGTIAATSADGWVVFLVSLPNV